MPVLDKKKQPIQTLRQALDAFDRLKDNRPNSNLPVRHRCLKFGHYAKTYLDFIRAGNFARR